MKKINILLVCNAGMSTSLIVDSIKKIAEKKAIACEVEAQPADEVKSYFTNKDIILLGPQVRFKKNEIQSLVGDAIPVEVMDMSAYGTMNGEKILDDALNTLKANGLN